MAKKQKVNKTQAVRDYLKTHPKAMSGEIAAALTKQGIKINAGHVANIKTKINKERPAKKAVKTKPVAAVPASPVAAEPEKNGKAGATVTLEHVKAVALTIKTVGGSARLYELLGLIKEVGSLKKFKDLLEAISGTETEATPTSPA
jgi:arginine repressor